MGRPITRWVDETFVSNKYLIIIIIIISIIIINVITGELGYDGPLYDGFLHMTDDMLGPSPIHIKYSSYV